MVGGPSAQSVVRPSIRSLGEWCTSGWVFLHVSVRNVRFRRVYGPLRQPLTTTRFTVRQEETAGFPLSVNSRVRPDYKGIPVYSGWIIDSSENHPFLHFPSNPGLFPPDSSLFVNKSPVSRVMKVLISHILAHSGGPVWEN